MLEFSKLIPRFEWQRISSVKAGTDRAKLGYDALSFDGVEEEIGPEGCEDLYLQFKDSDKLCALSVAKNGIEEVGAQHLASLLTYNDSILYFSIQQNTLNEVAMNSLAQMLSINTTLVCLQLLGANIGPQGCVALANELEFSNRTLMQLDLSDNNIQNEGAKALAKALKFNDILTSLAIQANDLTNEGAEALITTLKVNYSVAYLDMSHNHISIELANQARELVMRNNSEIIDAFKYANDFAKEAPLRKAKVCIIGKDQSGKSALVTTLMGKPCPTEYSPTAGVKVTQVQARLNGSTWHRTGREPSAMFTAQFLSRFANVQLDKKVGDIEKQIDKANIGFAGLRKKGNRRGSVQQRRGSVNGKNKTAAAAAGGLLGEEARQTRRSSVSANSRQSRRSSVAASVINALMGEDNGRGRRASIKGLVTKMAEPFRRKVNDLLDDSDFIFYEAQEGDRTATFSEDEVTERCDVHVVAKARRERDNLGFNLYELSGNRVYYTLHHAFLSEDSVYVLVFSMDALLFVSDEEVQKDTIRYLNYWLKVVKYHAPEASLLIVGTHLDMIKKDDVGKVEHYLSRLVFPELHKLNQKKKEALKVNAAIEAANEFAKSLEAEAKTGEDEVNEEEAFVEKKMNLVVNSKDRRLFFPCDLTTGKGVDNVRYAIDQASQKQKYFAQKIPVRWLKFLDALRTDSDFLFLGKDRVKALAFQTLHNHEEEMVKALTLFHELGYIVYITEIEQLKDTVITDTLKFHHKIFRLVFTDEISTFNYEKAIEAGLEPDLDRTMKEGLVSEKLLDFLWAGKPEEKKFLLDYTQLTLMLSSYNYPGVSDKLYLVPSLLPSKHDIVRDIIESQGEGAGLHCYFSFRGFLTLGVYERLVCLCVQYSSHQTGSKEPILAMGWSQHYFGDSYTFRLERKADDILLNIVEANKPAAKLVKNVEKMFGRIKQFLGKGFLWETLLTEEKIPYAQAKKDKLPGWFK